MDQRPKHRSSSHKTPQKKTYRTPKAQATKDSGFKQNRFCAKEGIKKVKDNLQDRRKYFQVIYLDKSVISKTYKELQFNKGQPN